MRLNDDVGVTVFKCHGILGTELVLLNNDIVELGYIMGTLKRLTPYPMPRAHASSTDALACPLTDTYMRPLCMYRSESLTPRRGRI